MQRILSVNSVAHFAIPLCIQRAWNFCKKATICRKELKEVACEDNVEAVKRSRKTITTSSPFIHLHWNNKAATSAARYT
eukprot:5447697-Amphidinium_carterae.2